MENHAIKEEAATVLAEKTKQACYMVKQDEHLIEKMSGMMEELKRERQKIRESRVIYVVVIAILFNALIFNTLQTWTAPFVIGAIELLGVYVMYRFLSKN